MTGSLGAQEALLKEDCICQQPKGQVDVPVEARHVVAKTEENTSRV